MGQLRLFQQCLVLFALIFPLHSWAGIYVYVDERGVKHYTNTPTSNRYRPAAFPRLNTPRSDSYYNSLAGKSRDASGMNNSEQYDRQIKTAANTHRVDPLLIKAIIKAESDFDQFATSAKGAQGLMQLMPETARDMRVGNPYNPTQNINGGTRYFRQLLDTYGGDMVRSLAAYNAGPGRVAKNGPLPRIKETREYVKRVTGFYRLYQQARTNGTTGRGRL